MRIDFWHQWEQKRKLTKKLLEIYIKDVHNTKAAEEIHTQLDCLEDRKRFYLANRYFIKIPDEWVKIPHGTKLPINLVYKLSQSSITFSLTPEGRFELDSIIRQKRRENMEWWVTTIFGQVTTFVVGLAGMIVGVIIGLYKL